METAIVRDRRWCVMTAVLNDRERQPVALILKGTDNKNIAWKLHLAIGTIKQYLNILYTKLGVRSRTELAVWAVRNPDAVSGKRPDLP